MTNILKVVKPFFVMEPGDTFELSENGMYVSAYDSEYSISDAEDAEISSVYNSRYSISKDYAEHLKKEGYIEEVSPKTSKNDTPYVNVFDEIETMMREYSNDLSNLDEDCIDLPACVKVEKETVLTNIMTVLEHLHSLKK